MSSDASSALHRGDGNSYVKPGRERADSTGTMNGSSDWGWHRTPAVPADPSSTPPAASKRPSRAPRLVLAAVVLVAVIALVVALGGSGKPAPAGSGASGSWSSARGVALRSAYLTGCQHTGQTAAYCGCLFSFITSEKAYNTPAAFSSVETGSTSATAPVVTQAESACDVPKSSGAPVPSAI
jgi:hypothetical protein